MRLWFKNRPWIFALIVATFFLCARAGSVAHAAQYGSAPHDHDGKICVLSVVGHEDNQVAILPPGSDKDYAPQRYEIAFSYVVQNPIFTAPHLFIKGQARSPPAK